MNLTTKLSAAAPVTARFRAASLNRVKSAGRIGGPTIPPAIRDALESEPSRLHHSSTELSSALGVDLSQVKIHTGERARASTSSLGARAYTVGSHIVLGVGSSELASPGSTLLIAHELAHVAQQSRGTPASNGWGTRQLAQGAAETEAREFGARWAFSGKLSVPHLNGSAPLGALQLAPATPVEAEAEWAALRMFGILQAITRVGAEVTFTFYASRGAMTLVSVQQTSEGGEPGEAVDQSTFLRSLRSLPVFVGTGDHYFQVSFARERGRWAQTRSGTLEGTAPEQARSIPLEKPGGKVDSFLDAVRVAKEMSRLMFVPPTGTTELTATVDFFDDRITGWEVSKLSNPGGSLRGLPPTEVAKDHIVQVLMALATGLGPRKITVTLVGRAARGASSSDWVVRQAGEPPRPMGPEAEPDAVVEYRRMHEQFFVQARAELKETGLMVAGWTLEQLALWIIGGVVFRLLGVGIEAIAPGIAALLKPGTKAAVETLGELVAELAPEEEAELRALAAKAESAGVDALGAAEKSRLNAILGKLERLLQAMRGEREALFAELRSAGAKFSTDKVVWIVKSPGGRVVWLEEGTAKSGLQHILEREAETSRFAKAGIAKDDIAALIRNAVKNLTPVEVDPINERYWYEVTVNGVKRRLGVGIASNGYISTAIPGPSL